MENRCDVLIAQYIRHSRTIACKELDILQSTSSPLEISCRLLYLFQRDLLSSPIGALVLDNKLARDSFYRDNEGLAVLSAYAYGGRRFRWPLKAVVAVIILLWTVGMIAYLLLFFSGEQRVLQEAWLMSFVLWLVLDMLLISTAEVRI